MIVLFNIHLKPHRTVLYERPNLKTDHRIDVFKYSIATHACMEPMVSKYIFLISIAQEWENRKDEIEKFISDNLDNEKVEIRWKANETLEEWQSFTYELDKIEDKTIYFVSNEDHIFVDYDLSALFYTVKAVEDDPNPFSAMFYSHWPELIRVANRLGGFLHPNGYCVNFTWSVHDSIRLMRKELWRKYWFDWDFKDMEPTNKIHTIKKFLPDTLDISCYVPIREICRHYDGYSHVGDIMDYYPPLEIPKGFCSNTMTVRYGWNDIWTHDFFTNVNPSGQNLKTKNKNQGFDYKFTLDKFPLSWWGRISDLPQNPHMDEAKIAADYEKWFLDGLKVPMSAYCMHFTEENTPPKDWFKLHLTQAKLLRHF